MSSASGDTPIDTPGATLTFTVGDGDTADALGSGDLAVLATPRLLAWCEAATCAVDLRTAAAPGRTSVGTRVQLEHLMASGVGTEVQVTATLERSDGRLLHFAVVAHDDADRLLATGEVTRVLVDAERFLARVPAAGQAKGSA